MYISFSSPDMNNVHCMYIVAQSRGVLECSVTFFFLLLQKFRKNKRDKVVDLPNLEIIGLNRQWNISIQMYFIIIAYIMFHEERKVWRVILNEITDVN